LSRGRRLTKPTAYIAMVPEEAARGPWTELCPLPADLKSAYVQSQSNEPFSTESAWLQETPASGVYGFRKGRMALVHYIRSLVGR